MRLTSLFLAAGVAACVAVNALAAENCSLARVASIPIDIAPDGRILASGQFNGMPVKLLLEMAKFQSYITDSLVRKLGIVEHGGQGGDRSRHEQDGGILEYRVHVGQIRLGELGGEEVPVRVLEGADGIDGADGTLGTDWFYGLDVEIDPAGHRLNLYSQDHCAGQVVYWTDKFSTIDGFNDPLREMLWTPAILDGKTIRATLDTGSAATTLSAAAAQTEFDVTATRDGARPTQVTGITGNPLMSFDHTFGSLQLGPLTLVNKAVAITDFARYERGVTGTKIPVSDNSPQKRRLMLGMDVIGKLHLFIAYKEEKIYFTPADAGMKKVAAE
jgi:hypothetical protein